MAVQYEDSQKGSVENVNINVPTEGRRAQWFHTCSPQYLFLIVMLVAAVLVSLVTLIVFLTRYQPANATNPVKVAPIIADSTYNIKSFNDQQDSVLYPIDSNVTLPPKLNIITRREWIASPPNAEATPLLVPVPYVFIMETSTDYCSDRAACTFHVRFLQSVHIDSRGWDDIAYNFLVGGDGFAYEGRGWKSQGAHTLGYNSKSIGIAFVGTFNTTMPPERQIIAAKQLINIGLEKGYIDPNFKLLATRQVESTKTPGVALYEDLQKWPRWADQP